MTDIQWGKPGRCPSCGVLTEHAWMASVYFLVQDRRGEMVPQSIQGTQGELRVSRCVSESCGSLAVWFYAKDDSTLGRGTHLVFPTPAARVPPEEGLTDEEMGIYEEAAMIEHLSPRSGYGLVRTLLEAVLKRMLQEEDIDIKGKRLVDLIGLGVDNLGLSRPLKDGLTAIRKRGNTAVHDPYQLSRETAIGELIWLFKAVDDLIEDVHHKRQSWANMT